MFFNKKESKGTMTNVKALFSCSHLAFNNKVDSLRQTQIKAFFWS